MKEKIGAYCTIRWNDTGDEVSECLFSFEDYNADSEVTAYGIVDSDIFFYANSAGSLEAMLNDARGDFTLVSIDDWITNA